ncbi:NADH dehydrogenase FAD-containing subunit [Lysinibacillus macroides]|uniref:NADH dehydrogenase FAD-containing subunit n=1 Tax=Lysinibacillus macroides TaxID=33935 RepID=UPI001936D2CC|nr:NADH dehydrogenase FAD-containing subunit [Lysinibacillus macroides]
MLIEYKKLLKNKNFYLSLFLLILIVVIAVFIGVNTHKEEYQLLERIYEKNATVLSLISPHKQWIGFSSASNFASSLYYFFFPAIISIALVDSIYREKRSGNQNYLFMRMNRKKYYTIKFATTYITAFLLFVLPLLLGVILINLFTNHWDYAAYATSYKQLVEGTIILPDDAFKGDILDLFSDFLITSPYVYMIFYYVLGGLFASGYICMGLALSMFIKNHYLVIFMPQIIYIACWGLLTALGKPSWDPFNLISPRQSLEQLSVTAIIVTFLLQHLLAFAIYFIGIRRNRDVL